MMSSLNPEQIELIERYLAGELNTLDSQAFEDRLNSDEEFREFFERHQVLVEGLEFSFYQQEREKMQRFHEEIMKEEETTVAEMPPIPKAATKARVISLRQALSIAAVFLIGLTAGSLFMNRDPQVSPPTFGGSEEGVELLYENAIPVMLINTRNNTSQLEERQFQLVLNDSKKKEINYSFRNDSTIQIDIPNLAQRLVDLNSSTSVRLIVERKDNPPFQAGILQIDQKNFLIPLDHDVFSRLFQK